MTLLLALLAAWEPDIRVSDLFAPTARVELALNVVPAIEFSMHMTPALGGGVWLVAEYREGGDVQRLSGWVPPYGARLSAVDGLALNVAEAGPVMLAGAR